MQRIVLSSLFLLAFVVAGCCSSATSISQVSDNNNPAYEVELVVQKSHEGQFQTVASPRIMVQESVSGTARIADENSEYSFTVLIHRRDGQLVATTNVKMMDHGQAVASPILLQAINEDAVIVVDNYQVTVRVTGSRG